MVYGCGFFPQLLQGPEPAPEPSLAVPSSLKPQRAEVGGFVGVSCPLPVVVSKA